MSHGSTASEKSINKLLLIIAKQGEVYQTSLEELTGLSYRQILRQLEFLQRLDLIHLKRTEPSSKQGKEKNIWELTFRGLMRVLTRINLPLGHETEIPIDFDIIANKNREKWIIFREWDLLSKDKEVKRNILFGIINFALKSPWAVLKSNDHSELKIWANLEVWQKKEIPDFLKETRSIELRDATLAALRLDDIIFGGFVPNPETERANSSWIKMLLSAMKSKELGNFIKEQFAHEEAYHRRVRAFEKWLLAQSN